MKVTIADDIRGVFDILNGWAPTVIAGGCLRDMIHGVKFKDVDFIIEGKPDPIATNPDEILEGYWSGGYYGDAGCENIIDVFKGVTKDGTNYDVICVKSKYKDHIDNFDFGINQVWWDGQLHVTKKFVADHLTETLNFTKPEYDIRTTRNRGVRIASKLGFTFQGVKYEKPKPKEDQTLTYGYVRDVTRYMQQNTIRTPVYEFDWGFAENRVAQHNAADQARAEYWRQQAVVDMQAIAEWHTQQMAQVRRPARIEEHNQRQDPGGYRDWMGQQAIDRMNQARQEHQERVRRMAENYRGVWQR